MFDPLQPVDYTLRLIDGDYAVLVTDDGLENRVARALLPPEADEGDRLRWENLGYTVL